MRSAGLGRGRAQCAFRTRLCAAWGRTRPCAALSPVHARLGPRRRPVPAAGPGTGANARGEQDKLWLGDEQDGTTRRFPGTKPPRLVHELTASQREGESIWGQRAGAALGAGDPTTPDTAQTPLQAAQGGTSRASCRGGARVPPDPGPRPAWASTAWGAPPSPTAMRASAFPGFVRSHSPKLLAHLWDQKTPRSISPIVQPWAFDVILNGATAVRPQLPRGARSRSVGFPHPYPGGPGPSLGHGGPLPCPRGVRRRLWAAEGPRAGFSCSEFARPPGWCIADPTADTKSSGPSHLSSPL